MKRRYCKGMLTVEASVMMPFLFVVTITMIYFVIYAYDRVIATQDVNALAYSDMSSELCYLRTYDNIIDNNIYIAFSDMKIEKTKKTDSCTYIISGNWSNPVWPGMKKEILIERDIKVRDIYSIMMLSYLVLEESEDKNGNSD